MTNPLSQNFKEGEKEFDEIWNNKNISCLSITYDNLKDWHKSQLLSQIEVIKKWAKNEINEQVNFPEGANMLMPYNQMLLGYNQALENLITFLEEAGRKIK